MPITRSILLRLLTQSSLVLSPLAAARFTLICILGFFGLMRVGELLPKTQPAFRPTTSLCLDDITTGACAETGKLTLCARIKFSKTDQLGLGRNIVFFDILGDLSVHRAYTAWLSARSTLSTAATSSALFLSANGKPHTVSNFHDDLKSVCRAANIPVSTTKPHSFRKGGATTLAAAGFSDTDIMYMGNWKSNAFRAYIVTPLARRAEIMAGMASSIL
jgi:hypothetical protein